ncbi:MAG: hypothetical protein Q8L04_11565 [Ignavibacteria bacterium]|nr:hypothetical protein [Ignavibacteria bacterium]
MTSLRGFGFMRSAKYAGHSYRKMLKMIIDLAYERKLVRRRNKN